ncbi:putative disease resistance protein At1g50180 isoform X3 [Phragmites australis]|uniref:putative disease resistance protein At1g50180 isoform X3 n=1 Tax=Phragmites australis TaxID=29695 RepID=UPI002D79ECA9|nr:putative disease resistance protein At1g50180 isoform X3 [Phragmites australis]
MEMFLSAVLGELTTRSINFFINKSSKPSALDVEDRLRRVLLRAQVIVDEAMGRHITNQAMLQQLDMLRDAMHRGYYMLDTFRYQSHDKEDAKDQPYNMHLLLGNCMFGRQMEAELIIKFLLHTQPNGSEELEVLPIIGPGKVGKTTLVAHVCKYERVRDHFSEILFLRDHEFTDDDLTTFGEGCAMKHQNGLSNSNKDRRLLVVVELVGDLNEDAWNRLHSASKQRAQSGSKIILISQSDKIVKFGTTQALTLKYLSYEAYWYFFKTLTFGSMDPEMHPRHVHLAMEIIRTLNGSLLGANMASHLLRNNFGIHFWCRVLAFLRGLIQKHVSRFGVHPFDLVDQNRTAHLGRMATPSEVFVVYDQYQRSSEEEVPKIRIEEVMYGNVKPHGKFEVLGWRSRIAPYYSYVYTCEIRELKTTAAKRKRSMRNGVTLRQFCHYEAYGEGYLNML